jgi:hypothetical protein
MQAEHIHPMQPTRKLLLPLAATMALPLATLTLSACGSGAGSRVVATVGHSEITRATLDHWMTTVVGGDYHQTLNAEAPVGLASEPADYPRCVAAAAQVVPKAEGKAKLSQAQLLLKCRQLHAAIKEQALSYLIAVLWRAEEGAELKATVSDAQVTRVLTETRQKQFKTPADFNRYLAERHWTVGDERTLLKRNLLDTKFLERLKREQDKLGGGQRTYVRLVNAQLSKWTARTDCAHGYQAWQCRQYKRSKAAKVSPAQIFEQLTAGKS